MKSLFLVICLLILIGVLFNLTFKIYRIYVYPKASSQEALRLFIIDIALFFITYCLSNIVLEVFKWFVSLLF